MFGARLAHDIQSGIPRRGVQQKIAKETSD